MSHRKIKSLTQLTGICKRLKEKGKRIVHCHGVFDLVHPGHIRHLKSAKEFGDVLIVTITKDKHVKRGPGRPVFNDSIRSETLAELSVTDYVASVDAPTALEAIKAIKPHAYVKGQDYRNRRKDVTGKIFDEEAAVKKGGGRLQFTDEITFSSSALINSHLESYSPEVKKYLKQAASSFGNLSVEDILNTLKNKKVLVIGDAIIDQYHYCKPMGKSSKEPIVVNRYLSEESFAGGSLATANHVAEAVGKCDLLTVLGEERSYEGFIRKHLSSNIKPKFFLRKDAPTTIKRRFVGSETKQKFFEVCYMEDSLLEGSEEKKVITWLANHLKKYDAVIVNDFGHGMMTPAIIKTITQKAKYLALNVQTNSANIGFNMVTKYPKADFVCIDELELRLAMHDKRSELKILVKKLAAGMKSKQVAVTRGHKGSLTYKSGKGFYACPAFAERIVDKVGAGDAFFAFTAPCFAAGMNHDIVSFLGNAVGSIAVGIVGNRETVKRPDLLKFVTRLLKF